MKIQVVTSPGGITAWLVEAHEVPLIAMRFAFEGGSVQDPKDQNGVAYFVSGMLDEGAGDLNSVAFQERLEETAARMNFDATRDVFIGNFQTLTKNADESFELLRLALNEPRFDQDAVERIRQQILAGLEFDSNDPENVAAREWYKLAFADHPYALPVKGTKDTVGAIGPGDLKSYANRIFARDTLKVAVVGDINAETLAKVLDEVFGGLPASGNLTSVPEAKPPVGPQEKLVEMNIPQSVAQFGHSAFKRNDDDFIASYMLNYILGGGGFSSRLMEEVREKRGLAYSVYSYVHPYERAAIYAGNVATKSEAIGTSLDVIRGEIGRMAESGPSEEELQKAKQYLTGSYALRFDTNSKIASQLIWIQLQDLGLDYVDKRNDLINAVSLDDVKRVAKRLLKADGLIVTIVGKPESSPKKPARG
jgi:zinc protease